MKKNQEIVFQILSKAECGLTIREIFDQITDDQKVEFKGSIKTLNGVLSYMEGLLWITSSVDAFAGKRVFSYEISHLGREVFKKELTNVQTNAAVESNNKVSDGDTDHADITQDNFQDDPDLPVAKYPLSAITEYIVEEKITSQAIDENDAFDEAIEALIVAYMNKKPHVMNYHAKLNVLSACAEFVKPEWRDVLLDVAKDIEAMKAA